MMYRPPASHNQWPWCALKAVVALVYAFMLGPILITASVSFNEGTRSRFPPEGFSTRWWAEAMSPVWLDPLLFSLQLATLAALASTVLALPLAFGIARHKFPGRDALVLLTLGPLMLPALVTGVGLLQMFHLLGLGQYLGFTSLVASHVVICMPFCVRTIVISLHAMPATLDLAAMSLGATPIAVYRRIIFPLIKNGLIAGLVFAFVHSFTDVNISLFLTRPGEQPITVKIIGFLEFGFSPTLAAVSIITLIIPVLLVGVVQRVSGLGDFVYGGRGRA